MVEILQLEFMQRALLAGIILAPLLAVLGSFVTLRKMSFFAEGIAHASLLGVAIAMVASLTPFNGALIVGVFFGILVYVLERYTNIASDSVIGIVFTTGLALGVMIISTQPGYQPDLLSFLFGSILAITWSNVYVIFGLSVLILGFVAYFFKQLTLLTLSKDLAWTSGINTKYLDLAFYVLISISVVLGVKLLGIILVSALLITPAVTSKLITRSFSNYVSMSVAFALVSFIAGLFISFYLDLPSGASIVVTATTVFVVVLLGKSLSSISTK